MNSLKIKPQKCQSVKGKLNNMEQVQIEYCKINIWKVDEFNILNEEVEELTKRWSPTCINIKSPSYLKQKHSNVAHEEYIIY